MARFQLRMRWLGHKNGIILKRVDYFKYLDAIHDGQSNWDVLAPDVEILSDLV